MDVQARQKLSYKATDMYYEKPYEKSPDGYSVLSTARYFGSAWVLVRNSDNKVLKTGSVWICLHEKWRQLQGR